MKEILSILKQWTTKIGQQFAQQKAASNIASNGASFLKSMPGTMKRVRLENPVKSVGMKLFIIFLVSILFFVLTVGFTSYNISKGVIQKKVADASEQTIIQAGQKLDLLYGSFEDLTLQILLDVEIKKILTDMATFDKTSFDYLQLRKAMGDKLNVYSYANKSIKSFQLFQPTGEPVANAGTSSGNATIANEDWFKKVVEGGGRAVWLDTRVKGYSDGASPGGSFAIGRVMKNPSNNSTQAILLLEVSNEVVGKELAQVQMGDGGQTLILSPELNVIYAKDTAQIAKKAELDIAADSFTAERNSTLSPKKDLQLVYYQSVKSGWYTVGAMPVAELVKDARAISNVTWIMAVVAALIAGGIGFLVARMIGRPVVMLRNLMKEGEQGNLRVRMTVNSQDEIGQLGTSFNQMMEKITQLVQQTNQSAQEVLETSTELSDASKKTATSAKEIAVATEEIAGGASSLAVESERGNELTHNIGIQMKAVVDANVSMGTAASDVQKSSEQGIEYMSELINKTNATEAMTRSMVEKVDNLKESTSSIRKILEVLSNVSKQTNILSLNATIEAARAGAAGKGFMVVADEIRKLADQSRQSIAVVGEITEKIQKEIDETVNVLSNAYPIFQEQIVSVKEADLIFKQVQTHMGGFIGQLSEVTESISNLDAAQLVLSDAMSNVSAVAEESSATSQEVASLSSEQMNISSGLVRLSDTLDQLSNSLKESLSKFQV